MPNTHQNYRTGTHADGKWSTNFIDQPQKRWAHMLYIFEQKIIKGLVGL